MGAGRGKAWIQRVKHEWGLGVAQAGSKSGPTTPRTASSSGSVGGSDVTGAERDHVGGSATPVSAPSPISPPRPRGAHPRAEQTNTGSLPVRHSAEQLSNEPDSALGLTDLRDRAGLDVTRVAEHLQLHPTYVLLWEAGAQAFPADKAERLAELYGCTVSDVLQSAGATRRSRVGRPTARGVPSARLQSSPDAVPPGDSGPPSPRVSPKPDSTLRTLRLEAGLTQMQVAEQLGHRNQASVSALEGGKAFLYGHVRLRLSVVFGVSEEAIEAAYIRGAGTVRGPSSPNSGPGEDSRHAASRTEQADSQGAAPIKPSPLGPEVTASGGMSEPLGARLRRIRLEKGLSQAQVAEKLQSRRKAKVSQASVSKWERGKATPPPAVLMAFADVFNVPLTDLSPADAPPTFNAASRGQRLREARHSRGYTLDRLARDIGAPPAALDSWERDETQPAPDHVRRLTELLGLDLGWPAAPASWSKLTVRATAAPGAPIAAGPQGRIFVA
jgi:transcriptional regulator with XRE-family HTH domain